MTWRGGTYLEPPVRLVEDTGERIAVHLAEGTRFTLPPGRWPFPTGLEGWELDPSWRAPVVAPEGT